MKRMFLFHGPNEVVRRHRVGRLLRQLDTREREIVYTTDMSPSIFEGQVLSDSLFGGGQVYLLKNWDDLADSRQTEWEEVLLRALSSSSPHVFVLSAASVSKRFLSSLEGVADIQECKPLYGRDIIGFMREEFEAKGITVEKSVYEYLLDISHQSLEEIDRMMAVLIEAASQTSMVTLDLCQRLLTSSGRYSIFDLIRGIFMGDSRLALMAFRSLRLEGDSLQRIFAMIFRTTRLLWSYKTRGNLTLQQWAQKVSISLFEARRIEEYDQRVTQRRLSEWFQHIAYLEELSKSVREEVAEMLFEGFLVEG